MYSQSVGINTTNPDPLFKLDVNGPITSNGLRTIGGSNYISIFDQVGRCIKIYHQQDQFELEIDLPALSSGIYFIYADKMPVIKWIKN